MKSKTIRKILKITGLTLLSLIVLAFLIPVVFKKQVQALVKKEINKTIDAKVDFSDVRLSLFRHFPKVGIVIKDLVIVGSNEFAADTLLAAEKIDASAGLFSVLKGKNIKVHGLTLESPRIHALVDPNGKANWDIAKSKGGSDPTDTSASAFQLTLKNYRINNGYVLFRDEQANTFTELEGLDHRGSGNLTADVFTLVTSTQAESASFTQDGIPYLNNTRADIDADIKIDNTTNTYTFGTKDILLNNLKLSVDGFVRMRNDSVFDMDIKFNSPSNDFRDILSMIPDIYKKDFDQLKTSGKAVFNGFVKGTLTPEQTPAYDVNLEVKDGSFQYPDLPKPVKNIQLSLKASNPDGYPDNSKIEITKGHIEFDKESFDFHFIYKYPISIQLFDVGAKGKIDLSQISKYLPLEKGTKLAGIVWADAYANGSLKQFENGGGVMKAGGFFDVKNFYYSSNSFPHALKNGNIRATISNEMSTPDKTIIEVSQGHIEVGSDPVDFSLQLSKPFSDINFNGNAKGRFTLANLKQFTALPAGTSLSGLLNADLKLSGNKAILLKGEYDKLNLLGTVSLQNLRYITGDYPTGITVSNAVFNFNPANVNVPSFSGNYLGSNFSGNGTLDNLIGFISGNGSLGGNLNASLDKMNLNDWTGTKETSAATSASAGGNPSPFLVPANMNVTVNANAGQVTYDKVNYNNIAGSLVFAEETVKLQNVKANALEGTIVLNGSYSTKASKTTPDISLSYDIDDMDVQQAFYSFNPIQFIMPIGKFLSGKLSSELSMTGNLKGDMAPDLQSLSGKGNLLLLQGVLKKFAPLEKIAAILQVDRLKSISVKDIKNYIEFTNGKVLVKPFNVKVEEIEMIIGGRHGFDQTIDYIVDMKLPRKYMGSTGNDFINGLVTDANKKGIPLTVGDKIDLNIKVGGSLNNPSVKIDLAKVAGNALDDLKQQAEDFAKEKIDSLKQKVKDSISSVTDKYKDSLKQKLKDKIFGKDSSTQANTPDTTSKKPKPDIKKTLKDILNRNKKPKDSLNN